eukprot:4212294-Amphidinium_carterae.2
MDSVQQGPQQLALPAHTPMDVQEVRETDTVSEILQRFWSCDTDPFTRQDGDHEEGLSLQRDLTSGVQNPINIYTHLKGPIQAISYSQNLKLGGFKGPVQLDGTRVRFGTFRDDGKGNPKSGHISTSI